MNDNVPESERWLPVPAEEFCAESAKNFPALDRARREAEAVIEDRFKRNS